MLTVSHITTLLTIGVLLSAGVASLVEWLVKRTSWGASREASVKKWGPIFISLPMGLIGFPLAYSAVVSPVTLETPFQWVSWAILGLFAGACAGTGAWLSHDLARAVLSRVGR